MYQLYARTSIPNDGRVMRSIDTISSISEVIAIVQFNNGCSITNVSIVESKNQSYIYFLFLSLIYMIRNPRAVHYFHDYYCLPLALIAAVFRLKFVYDCHEFLPNKKNTFRAKIFIFLESILYKFNPLVIYPERHREKLAKRFYKAYKIDSVIIRNINESSFSLQPLSKDKELPNIIKIVYQGVVSRSRSIDSFFAFLKHSDSVHLTIIGDGPDLIRLKERVHFDDLGNRVEFLGSLDRLDLYERLNEFHLGMVFYDNSSLNNRWPAPNKIYEYTNRGLPIMCSNQVVLVNLVSTNNIGFNVDIECLDVFKIDKSVCEFKKNYSEIVESVIKFAKLNSMKDEQEKLKQFCKECFHH